MRLNSIAVCACALLGTLLAASPASADVFGSISLVSQGALGGVAAQQAEYAHDTAISADGHYVVFDGSIGGVRGVWRRDLQTGELQQVAGGDAELPSVSEHGQYVSFTTNEGASLPEITYSLAGKRPSMLVGSREAVNVYVRDMTREPGEAGAFVLASAANGPGQPAQALTYQTSEPEKYGSVAVGRSAISADGHEVAFVTTAVSDLAGPNTPALQVAVRYLETNETKLVSRCLKCEAGIEPAVGSVESGQAYGAVYPGASDEFLPVPAYGAYGPSPPPGASISADGTTVAWIGENVEEQAPMLSAEKRSAHYTEPLWRRIAPPESPTERVTGGSDPGNPACIESGETSLPASPAPTDPCQGPFYVEEQQRLAGILNEAGASGGGEFVPRLSADGYTVLFTSEAPMVSLGENFGRLRSGQPSDLYLADMRPGLTRDQALRPITELAGGEGAGLAATAPIFDFEIAAGAGQLAFSTRRTQFILGSPALVSPPAGEPGLDELFDVDLADDTLTRVTHGYSGLGEPAEHPHTPRAAGEEPYDEPGDGALSPSLSADGSIVAFSSTASNLVYGDANAPPSEQVGPLDGSDAFVVDRVSFSPLPTPQYISPAPQVSTLPVWRLGVTALARSDGSVVLYLTTPGAGVVHASAQSAVLVRLGNAARSSRRSEQGKRADRSRRGGVVVRLETRTVASTNKDVGGQSLFPIALVLKLAKAYTALASAPSGLSTNVSVVFKAPGEPVLRQSLVVSFKRKAPSSRRRSGKTTVHLKPASGRR
jgi:WD40-like Beta Propeller Repeat